MAARKPKRPPSSLAEDEAFLVKILESTQRMLAKCRAETALEQQRLTRDPAIDLARWRALNR